MATNTKKLLVKMTKLKQIAIISSFAVEIRKNKQAKIF